MCQTAQAHKHTDTHTHQALAKENENNVNKIPFSVDIKTDICDIYILYSL
jgi:hypothetical protein